MNERSANEPQRLAQPLGKFKGCQYISGQPSIDNACKCGRATIEDSAYCAGHHRDCHIQRRLALPGFPGDRGKIRSQFSDSEKVSL